MSPLLLWTLGYLLPAALAVYIKNQFESLPVRTVVIHGGVLVSVAILLFSGVRLTFAPDIFFAALLILAFSTTIVLLGLKIGAGYVLSATIQEISILLAAGLLIPVAGIFISAVGTSFVFAFAHQLQGADWKQKALVVFSWGVVSILLYAWLEQPLLNIVLHTLLGALLIRCNFLGSEFYNTSKK